MENNKRKSLVPLILVIIGAALFLGALLAIIRRPKESQGTTNTPSNVSVDSSEIARVQPEAAKAAFDSGEAVFIDVRPAESFAASHIPGAISIPLSELQDRIDELDPKRWIIPY